MNYLAPVLLCLASSASLTVRGATETWVADPAESSVGFSVRNVMIRVSGTFGAFAATLTSDPADPQRNQVTADIQVASIDTNVRKRDAHLQQPEFFDAARFPRLGFRSTAWQESGPDRFKVTGDLAIRGTTRPVVLEVRLIEAKPDQQRWEARTKLNRHDFGVSGYNHVIGAEVDVAITLLMRKKS